MRYRDQIALGKHCTTVNHIFNPKIKINDVHIWKKWLLNSVRKLLEEEDERLKNLVDQADGLTEEEMGIVMEAAEPEEQNKSSYKWKSHAQKEKEKEELKQQLDSLFDENTEL